MRSEIDTRQARTSDREFARRAHHAAYRDVVERQFGPWDEVMQDRFFDDAWDPEENQIVCVDGAECGYCVVEHRPDDIHVRELVIHPEYQGRGIGTWILQRLQEEALGAGVPVRLGTFHKNHALRLYGRLGFREIGATETHVLMEWRPAAPLTGGGRTVVTRSGDTVLRETGPWAPTVHALLRHLEAVGFGGAPRVIGSGFDQRGREILGFVEGEVVHPRPWSEEALPYVGRLMRDLHRATETFTIPHDAVWRPWHGRSLGGARMGIGHCDTGPWNIVARGSVPVALIDWEVAGPVDTMVDLAHACWLNAQLHDDDVAEAQELAPLEARARHLRLILDGYELSEAQRIGFVDRMIEFAVQDAADEAVQAGVTPDTRDAAALWGVTWRIKSAAWMLRNRTKLEAAL